PPPPPRSTPFPYTTLFRSEEQSLPGGPRRRPLERHDLELLASFALEHDELRVGVVEIVEHELRDGPVAAGARRVDPDQAAEKLLDRKSTRLNSSHVKISYA